MNRVNVFLKDKLLDEINREVKEEKTNRSALIQAALEKYIEAKRREREEEKKRNKTREASCKINELAKELGDWDPIPIIRRFRDTNLKGEYWLPRVTRVMWSRHRFSPNGSFSAMNLTASELWC